MRQRARPEKVIFTISISLVIKMQNLFYKVEEDKRLESQLKTSYSKLHLLRNYINQLPQSSFRNKHPFSLTFSLWWDSSN